MVSRNDFLEKLGKFLESCHREDYPVYHYSNEMISPLCSENMETLTGHRLLQDDEDDDIINCRHCIAIVIIRSHSTEEMNVDR